MKFADRRHAGKSLGTLVGSHKPEAPIVVALPRGGVPVGFEVAAMLGCDLDVLGVGKLGAPGRQELAMGAVAEGGVLIRNDDVIAGLSVSEEQFEAVSARARTDLERRMSSLRVQVPALSVSGKTAIVVDDGLATGATARAALQGVMQLGAASAWLAVPVAPKSTLASMKSVASRVLALSAPRSFVAVGVWYRDFSQTSLDEAISLLVEARG
jgi:predicted phosphoribosyltransferase